MPRIEPVLLPLPAGADELSVGPGLRPLRPRRRRVALRWAIIISLQLHLLALAAFLLMPRKNPVEQPAENEVQMVFAPGSSAPQQMPGPEPTPQAPLAAQVPQTQPEPAPPMPPQPVPPQAQMQPPAPAVAAPPPPPATASQTAEEAELPVPPPAPTPSRQLQPQTPPAQAPVRQATPRAPAAPPSFPRPQFSDFGNVFGGAPSANPQVRSSGGSRMQAFQQVSGTKLGDDWWERFRIWVENHKYYPKQAIEQGQEGVVMVQVEIGADGRVRQVDLQRRSGSQWLDMGLVGMFRNATVPPISAYVPDKTVTVDVQMSFMLMR